MVNDLSEARSRIVDSLRREIIGPRNGINEVLSEEVNKVYTAGILYPQESSTDQILEEEEEDVVGAASDEVAPDSIQTQADEPIVLANQRLPSSMGISFYLRSNPEIAIRLRAGRYIPISSAAENSDLAGPRKNNEWQRKELADPEHDLWLHVAPEPGKKIVRRKIFNGLARLDVIWRPGGEGWLVTVTVINVVKGHSRGIPKPEDCLCQVELRCRASANGYISAYPKPRILSDDSEEEILDLLYRRYVAYGVGHGCSVNWAKELDGRTNEIWVETLPTCEVPSITYNVPGHERALDIGFLADYSEGNLQEWISELDRFVKGYQDWIEALPIDNQDIPSDLDKTRDLLLTRMRNAAVRMSKGIRLLEQNKMVRKAFALANRAMLQQMLHSTEEFAGKTHTLVNHKYHTPEASTPKTWRAFQLAFQLLTISSVADSRDPEREIVDLIWFPTGGGKTEAYLAVTAFLILYRRLLYGSSGAGTAVFMRYTLRLLTAQQFQRAATLICALEQMRRSDPETLGTDEISIGLWVGNAATPNTFADAFKKYLDLLDQETPQSPYQIDRCPWCGTGLIPSKRSHDYGHYGFKVGQTQFEVYCPNTTCPFNNRLPIAVVDEQLYEQPPSLLLATVDKFARLPWEARAGVFFGGLYRAPDLIIQDELHLISGPLGTIVGVYETAIDAAISWDGNPPKILASTATIRRADQQCEGLYARQVELFPPSGLDASDSYFARYDYARPGRLYCGVMGPGHTIATTMIRTGAALLQAPIELNLSGEALDAYWTLVAYHNSLRELGKVMTYAADDIPARIKVIASAEDKLRSLSGDNTSELTSNLDASELIGMLQRLAKPEWEAEEISFLACTNMLSVGVDVQRLGLMLVNGQPKSTSEYIQATSRVGRGSVPGLVVAVLSPAKPRDRSHYERFIAYHSAIYRHVEPTSVTPFAQPSRERALHAALVTLVRHKTGLSENSAAADFASTLPGLKRIADFLLDRVKRVDAREADPTSRQVQDLVAEWAQRAGKSPNLEYNSTDRKKPVLLRNVGDERREGWETLQSMRNVDRESVIRIVRE